VHYDEEIAQAFLHNGEIDNAIIYCLPMVHAYLKHHRWSFVNPNNYYDVAQELSISLCHSIRSYTPDKNAKLLTWIYINFRFTCLSIGKKIKPWQDNNVQLDDNDECLFYTEDQHDID